MEQYHSVAGTPLKFHKFFWRILLPLNFVSTALTMKQEFSVMTEFTWLFAVDALFFTVSLILMLACFVGFFGWKPYAWYSVMAFLGMLVVSGVCTVAVYAAYVPEELAYSVGQLLRAILEAVLIGKYYMKRRPLFFSEQPTAASFSAMDAHYLDDDAHLDDFSEEAADDDDFAEEADEDYAEDVPDDGDDFSEESEDETDDD